MNILGAFAGLSSSLVWDVSSAAVQIASQSRQDGATLGEADFLELNLLPAVLGPQALRDDRDRPPVLEVLKCWIASAHSEGKLVVFAQLHALPSGADILHLNDAEGRRWWCRVAHPHGHALAFECLQAHLGRALAVFPHARLTACCRRLMAWPAAQLGAYPPTLDLGAQASRQTAVTGHVAWLEAESIHILREAVSEAERPVMLYSMGKDSSVMLHLARKAFFPAPPPFPLLHVDTRWKFQEMYQFRDHMARTSGMQLLVHINPQAIARDINPFDHGSAQHTEITKTEGLKQALDAHRFDLVFGGARRDEEKSRAKERIFSFRNAAHQWDPRRQRPELWNLYNTRIRRGESIRVFPLSNWTEADIWQYIDQQGIAVVPLYFAKPRPVVARDGQLLVVDDARFRLRPGERVQQRKVRFRTLGCYPLTGAIDSEADSLPKILRELAEARVTERQGRLIDADAAGSMEKKKREGYF
jgi:sulfate adenylyltransferase subunit 2